MKNKNKLHSLTRVFGTSFGPSRLVYLFRRENSSDPTSTQDLRNRQRESHTITEKDKNFKRFEGTNLNDIQAVQDIQLGVNEEMRGAMERLEDGRASNLTIVDDRAKRRRRAQVSREMALERQRMGFWRRLGTRIWGGVRNTIGVFNENWDDIGTEERRRYGNNRRIENVSMNLAERVWNGLTPAQQNIVANWLSIRVFTPVPFGMPAGLSRLANADADTLVRMRSDLSSGRNVVFSPARTGQFPLYAGQIDDTHEIANPELFQPIDRLIMEKQSQTESRGDTISTTNLDYQRLQSFLDDLRSNVGYRPVYENLMKILKAGELYRLKTRPEQLALVHDLEHRFQVEGPTRLAEILDRVFRELEFDDGKGGHDDHAEHGEHHENPIEAVNKLAKALPDIHGRLSEAYRKADALGQKIYEYDRIKNESLEAMKTSNPAQQPNATGGTGQPRTPGLDKNAANAMAAAYKDAAANYTKAIDSRSDRVEEVHKLEAEYWANINELRRRIREQNPNLNVDAQHSPVYAAIEAFIGAPNQAPAQAANTVTRVPLSDPNHLFGVTNYQAPANQQQNQAQNQPNQGQNQPQQAPAQRPANSNVSPFRLHVENLNPAAVTNFPHEIEHNYIKSFKKRKQITSRELLFRLQRTDMIGNGITNQDQVNRMASEATNKRVREADHSRLLGAERHVNSLISERYGETRLGLRWLKRLEKAVKAKYKLDGYNRLDSILEEEIGREGKFKCLKGIKGAMTLTQVRDLIEQNGGANIEALREFAARLVEILHGFDLLNKQGRVKLLDRQAVDALEIIKILELIADEIEDEQASDEIARTEKDKGKAYMALQRKLAELRAKREKELYQPLGRKDANWKQRMSKRVLLENSEELVYEALKKRDEEKMSDWSFEQYLDEQGLTTAYEQMKTKLRVNKVLGVGAGAALGTWALASRGGNFVLGKGRQYLNAARNVLIKPAGSAIKAVGKEINKEIIQPVAGAAGALVMSPFRFVGWLGKKVRGGGGGGGGHH